MIKVGILGTGFGETHAELYKKIEGFEVVSIFGRNQEKLNEIGEKYNIPVVTDINEIITNPDIDLIDICLPTELHSTLAVEGLKNGKHIFCETPVTYSVDEAIKIQQAAAQYGKNVFVDMFLKFSPPHRFAADVVKKAELGRLLSVRSYNRTSPRWGDLGIQKNVETFHNHNMDFVIGLAGMPNCVTASGIDYKGESIVTSALSYNGMYAVLESNSSLPKCCPFEIGFELFFTDGVVRYDAVYGSYTKEEFSVTGNDKDREVLQLDSKDEYEEVIRHIQNCLHNNVKSDRIDIEDAVNTVKLKEMIMQSLRLK
nr:Gfo/Idh/MocA family oxidoreductase [uncultured Anaerocolumna sp.]